MARSRSPPQRIHPDRFPDAKAAGVVLWNGDAILIGYQPQTRKWSEPGGKKLNGESAAACAKRELREETGLLTEKHSNIQWDKPQYIPDCKYVFFQGRIGDRQPVTSTTFSEYQFVLLSGLPRASRFRLQRVVHFLRREAEERRRACRMDALVQLLERNES